MAETTLLSDKLEKRPQAFIFNALDFEDGTPTMPRKGSTIDEEAGEGDVSSDLQSIKTGGSQNSLNNGAALDNAEQFESLKQKKEKMEKGIQLWVAD